MKKVFLVLATCAVVSAALVGCGSSGDTMQSTNESVSKADVSDEKNSDAPSDKITTDTQSDKKTSDVLTVGSTGVLGDWEITLDKVEFLDSIQNTYGSFVPNDGNQYGVVTLSIKNNGKNSDEFLPMVSYGNKTSATIMYGDEYEYSATYLIGYDSDLHNKVMNPLSSATGVVAFDIPTSVVDGTESKVLCIKAGTDKLEFHLD